VLACPRCGRAAASDRADRAGHGDPADPASSRPARRAAGAVSRARPAAADRQRRVSHGRRHHRVRSLRVTATRRIAGPEVCPPTLTPARTGTVCVVTTAGPHHNRHGVGRPVGVASRRRRRVWERAFG
jgi:hypothetical protein